MENDSDCKEIKMCTNTKEIIISTVIQLLVISIIMVISFDILPKINLNFKIKGIITLSLVILDILFVRILLNKNKKTKEESEGKAYNITGDKMDKSNDMKIIDEIKEITLEDSSTCIDINQDINEDIDIPYLSFKNSDIKDKILLDKEIIKLGRGEECDFIIPVLNISKLHAQILKVEDLYYIEDLESKNGTFVNGEKVLKEERVALNNGDIITLANIDLEVYNKALINIK